MNDKNLYGVRTRCGNVTAENKYAASVALEKVKITVDAEFETALCIFETITFFGRESRQYEFGIST